jgi:cytochrome P450
MTHLLHRNAAYFERPDDFDPDRWSDEAHIQALPKLAYSPFGAGQRKCIGHRFAMTELVATLATIVPQVDLEATATRPRAQPAATLRPADGIRLRFVPRAAARGVQSLTRADSSFRTR